MWKPTIRGLLARRVRLVLTAAAVLLGVAFVSATYVLTDTVRTAFDAVFVETLEGVDLQVQGARALDEGDPPRIPDATVQAVRAVDGVAWAEGVVEGSAQYVARDGESIGGGGLPTSGVSWVDDGPFRLVDDGVSRPPLGPREVAMDAGTAREHGFAVGDRVRVVLDGPAREFEIVGLFGFGDRFDFGGVTYAAFDLETAQQVLEAPGSIDVVLVQRDPRVAEAVLRQRLQRALGSEFDVLAAADAANAVGEPVREILGFFTLALLGFAAIGVVVGAFVIFNTFTILVAQRTRELGLLRALGASRRQVVGSVVLEAFIVGSIASGIGLAAGVLLAVALLDLLRTFGQAIPATTTVLEARTIVVSLVVGVGVTVLASLVPATRAARVAPMAAINEPGSPARTGVARRVATGLAVAAGGSMAVVLGLVRAESVSGVFEQVQVVALGAFALLVGVVLLLTAVARPLASWIGLPLRALGTSGVLARANAMRNPRRTAVTASALVIGLALVGLTATLGASARASVRRDTAAGLAADYVVKSDGFAGFSSVVRERLAALPELDAVLPLQIADGAVSKRGTVDGTDGEDAADEVGTIVVDTVGALEPRRLDEVVRLELTSGGISGIAGGVLLDTVTARRVGVGVGDVVSLLLSRGAIELPVRGIFRNDNFIGIFGQEIPIIVSPKTLALGAGGRQDTMLFVKVAPGQDAEAEAQMRRALGRDFPNIDVLTREEFRSAQLAEVDQFVTVLTAILALSVIIAVLGIVNTLALSVFERTRELGLLRTVGMSRRQLRRMVRWESVVIAVIGATIGIALGLVWGWVFTRSLRSEGLSVFSVPVAELGLFLVLAVLAGLAAAIGPAWRASRLDVLEAIATE